MVKPTELLGEFWQFVGKRTEFLGQKVKAIDITLRAGGSNAVGFTVLCSSVRASARGLAPAGHGTHRSFDPAGATGVVLPADVYRGPQVEGKRDGDCHAQPVLGVDLRGVGGVAGVGVHAGCPEALELKADLRRVTPAQAVRSVQLVGPQRLQLALQLRVAIGAGEIVPQGPRFKVKFMVDWRLRFWDLRE